MATTKKPASASTASGPLGFLNPRETKRARKAKKARRGVNRLKIILPVASGIVLLGLMIWPYINPDQIISKALKNVPDIVIQNLNFTDFDSKHQPYSISASKATRPSGQQNLYDLENPQGEITLQEGSWIAAKSRYGRIDKDSNHLWLGGNVQIFHDKGYEFTTDELQADLNDHNAWGEKPVLIQGTFGQIRGIGFRLVNSGNTMIVKGPAKAVFNLHGGQASDKPAEGQTAK